MDDEHAYLVEEIGLSEDEAQARLQDSDLWLLEPELRYNLGVEEWEDAVGVLCVLDSLAEYHGGAVEQVIRDAQLRAEEALRRARERAENGH